MRSGVGDDQQLAERAAGVVADQRDVGEVERLDDVGDQRGEPAGERSASALQRQLVRAERQVGHDAAEAVAQPLDDRLPQTTVDQRAVDEEERRAGALVAVADRSLLQRQLGHRVRPSR